jgi:hypothetical protein
MMPLRNNKDYASASRRNQNPFSYNLGNELQQKVAAEIKTYSNSRLLQTRLPQKIAAGLQY